jgi:hypothetical protein
MVSKSLNGRLHRLEATAMAMLGSNMCARCGLRHVRPLTLALVRGVLRVRGGSAGDADGQPTSRAPLCLCACCTTDPGDRWFARLSHGLPTDEDAA